jgi:hypothetical protein
LQARVPVEGFILPLRCGGFHGLVSESAGGSTAVNSGAATATTQATEQTAESFRNGAGGGARAATEATAEARATFPGSAETG